MKKIKLILSLLMVLFISVGNVWATEGDELAICQGTGSGYGTRRTSTDSHSVDWVLASGQSGYIGCNNATNHAKIKPTEDDLPVVKAVDGDATTTTTGYYFYYTSTAVANVGSIQISHTANNHSSQVTSAYIVSSSTAASSTSATWTQVTLSSTSTSDQGDDIKGSGTYTFTFNAVETSAKYYGVVLATSDYQRLTGGAIKLLEGATSGGSTVSAVQFAPAAGTYEGTQNVVLSCSTTDATIYYTTDGSNPTTSETKQTYENPIAVSANTTIKAYAVKSGLTDGDPTEAAYVITVGPDVTLDFSNEAWSFPTDKVVAADDFNDGTYTITVAGSTGQGYKKQGSGLLLGQSGAYILLPEFANPIERIVCPGVSGASGKVTWNVFDGETAVSTEVTGCTADATFEITNPAADKAYTIKVTNANNLQISKIKIYYGAAPAVAKPTISGETPFYSSTQVSITCGTTGASIYYTTDGTNPTTSSTAYSGPFELSATATVKAIAVKGSDVSQVAEKTFTKLIPYTTLAAIFEAATSTSTQIAITFDGWKISYVKGTSNAYLTDGTNGLIIYEANHGFNVGDALTGSAICNLVLYKGAAEITGLTNASEGLTVTAGSMSDPVVKAITDLGAVNTGALITLEEVTYDGTDLVDALNNTIKPHNSLYSDMAFENGKKYNVTGIASYYDALQILPRSAADIVEVVEAGAPEAPTFTPAAGTYTSAQSVTLACETDGATIYYTTNGDVPDDQSTEYSEAISVGEDMTIKAIAYKAGVPSAVATATYSINIPLTTMDAIFAKATAVGGTATDVTIVLNDWVVSGIYTNNKDVFVTDGSKGFIIYDSGASMGFNVGDVLSGTVACKVQLFKGAAEVTNLNSSTAGLTVTSNGSATLNTKTIDQLGAINAGALVKIENLTYDGTSKKLSNGANEITPYKGLFESMAFEDGKKYNVTGVVGYYDVLQIMPRSADDIEEIVLPDPELSYSPATLTIQEGDAWSAPTLNNPNNVTIASYVSSNVSVATVTDGGVIELAGGLGTAVITASFSGDATYSAGTATYTITVNEAAPVLTDYYEKVTSGEVTEGTYLIVYETGKVAFNGGLETLDAESNTIAVDITSANQIEVTQATEAATFYIDPTAGTVKSASGNFIGVSSWSNGLKQDKEYVHNVLEIDGDGNAQIGIYNAEWNTTGGTMRLQYNKSSGQTRFRYYKNGGQQSIALYKLANEVIKPAAGLAWDPADNIEITVGAAFSAPTLLNPNSIDAAEITIESSNTNLATVTNGVVSLVENATGSTTITATFAGNDDYKPATVSYTIKVNPAYEISTNPASYLNFGTKEQGATIDDKTLAVTLSSVAEATVVIAGDGAAAFSASPMALTASGDITVSASSANVGTFAATLTISDNAGNAADKVINLSLTVTEPETPEAAVSTTSEWVAATDADLVDGKEVLITGVKEVENVPVTYAMGSDRGNNRNAVAGTLDEGVFTPGEGTMAFTLVDQGDGTFALKASNDKYLYAASSSSNNLKTRAAIENGDAKWSITTTSAVANGENTNKNMKFNTNSTLFSCYGSGQAEIAFYVPKPVPACANPTFTPAAGTYTAAQNVEIACATDGASIYYTIDGSDPTSGGTLYTVAIAVDASMTIRAVASKDNMTNSEIVDAVYTINVPEPPTPDYGSYQRDVTCGNYGTICLPKAGTISGAKLYELADYEGGMIYVDEITDGAMVAGRPYLFFATSAQLNVAYTSDQEEATAGNYNGLYGFYNLNDPEATLTLEDDATLGNYILYQNQYWLVSGRAASIANYRAYIKVDMINYVAPAPGRQRVAMVVNGNQVATGIENAEASEVPTKMLINGQLFIIRGEKMYNVNGQVVK